VAVKPAKVTDVDHGWRAIARATQIAPAEAHVGYLGERDEPVRSGSDARWQAHLAGVRRAQKRDRFAAQAARAGHGSGQSAAAVLAYYEDQQPGVLGAAFDATEAQLAAMADWGLALVLTGDAKPQAVVRRMGTELLAAFRSRLQQPPIPAPLQRPLAAAMTMQIKGGA
jgi:hypothetical protein